MERPAAALLGLALAWLSPLAASSAQTPVATEIYTMGQTAAGPVPLALDLYRPAAGCAAPCPLVIVIHGGGFTNGSKGDSNLVAVTADIIAGGYAVAMINYRLADSDPVLSAAMLAYLEGAVTPEEWLQLGADNAAGRRARAYMAAIEDTEAAIAWLAANAAGYDLDASRIALLGSSAGAITALNTAYGADERGTSTASEIVGVVDYWGRLNEVFPMAPADLPVMVLHGDADTVVTFDAATDLAAEAAETGTDIWYLPLAGVGHGLSRADVTVRTVHGLTITAHTIAFLDAAFAGTTGRRCLSDTAQLCRDAAFREAAAAGSVLPGARSTAPGEPATAFASLTNGGEMTAEDCRLVLLNAVDAAFSYQTASPLNLLTGAPDTPVDIPPGGTQNFLFSLTPNSEFASATAIIDFVCADLVRADYRPGLTDFRLSSEIGAPDVLAIAASLSGDGVARLPAANRVIPFSVSAVNIAGEASLTVRPEDGALDLPLVYDICEADAAAVCIGPRGREVTTVIGAEPRFFVVRAKGQDAGLPLLPDVARTDIVFLDAGGVERGRTGLASTAPGRAADPLLDPLPSGIWSVDLSGDALAHGEVFQGVLFVDADGETTAYSAGALYGEAHTLYGLSGAWTADPGALPSPRFDGEAEEVFDGAAAAFSAKGTWLPESEIRGTLRPIAAAPSLDAVALAQGENRRVRAVYSLLTREPASPALIAGAYELIETGGAIGDLEIDPAGSLSGQVGDCAASGSLRQVTPEENIFDAALILTGSCSRAGVHDGHAARLEDGALRLVLAGAGWLADLRLRPVSP